MNHENQKNKLEYDQYVAFINRETELNRLRKFVNKEQSEILFLHGPKSSGKTTLLYKFFDQIQKEQKMDVKFLNLEKYSKIKNYTLTKEDAEKIWDTVGGSMWEIQNILGHLFDKPINEVLAIHKKKMKGIISYYIGVDDQKESSSSAIVKFKSQFFIGSKYLWQA